MSKPTSQRSDGPTPHGGTYAIANWRDANGTPTTKDDAVAAEIIEFDAQDREVFRTIMEIRKSP